MLHKKTMLFLLSLMTALAAIGQENTTSSGGDATGNGGTVAYSVGQINYTYQSEAGGNISEGVQQAYEIFTVGIESKSINISLKVFPNPTSDRLTLQVSDYKDNALFYQLIDLQGKLLQSGQISDNNTQINMQDYATATYLVKVVEQNNTLQTFKIIKTK